MSEHDFDPEKSERCFRERGFDFDYAARVFDGETVEFVDNREDYGEVRLMALGHVDGHALAVGYTMRGDLRWIFSAFRCDIKKEIRRWQRHAAASR